MSKLGWVSEMMKVWIELLFLLLGIFASLGCRLFLFSRGCLGSLLTQGSLSIPSLWGHNAMHVCKDKNWARRPWAFFIIRLIKLDSLGLFLNTCLTVAAFFFIHLIKPDSLGIFLNTCMTVSLPSGPPPRPGKRGRSWRVGQWTRRLSGASWPAAGPGAPSECPAPPSPCDPAYTRPRSLPGC